MNTTTKRPITVNRQLFRAVVNAGGSCADATSTPVATPTRFSVRVQQPTTTKTQIESPVKMKKAAVLNSIIDEWRENVPSTVWDRYDPDFSSDKLVQNNTLPSQLTTALRLICCPGIYCYGLLETVSLNRFYIGGNVEHIFGTTGDDVLSLNFGQLVSRFCHPDDQAAYLQFTQKSIEFALAHNMGRHMKRTFFYRIKTADGRTHQIMHQGQTLFYDMQGFPAVQLEVQVDVSHIRAPDARPMMTLLDNSDPANPIFYTTTVEGTELKQGEWLLSPRELEVLRLLADGKTSKQVAYALSVSPNTVNNHRQKIMAKLNAKSTTEAVNVAIKNGYI